MADFHFLRPWWLALLPVAVWLIWQLVRGAAEGGGWRALVDAPLREHVLAEPEVLRESRAPLAAALACAVLALVALAGPTWERLPVPAFRSEEALVVALDLSRSMDAADVEPSRLARARLKVLDLLERRAAGQTALVVFSTHAFTVTPLTTDTRTISALVGAVSTSIMPTQGSSLASGLDKAASLLRQTSSSAGDILAITDADVVPADVELAGKLRGEGFLVSVLAVGTEQGAPIPRAEGGFVTDGAGAVVIPQLDVAGLARVAAAGGGRFARLAPDDRDLESLFPAAPLPGAAQLASDAERQQADVWRDRGGWLALALLPLLALVFRRGWIAGVLVVLLLPTTRAHAFEWQDLWQRPDQRGYEALRERENERAAQLFEDPQWRSAAQYRAGKFADSAASLGSVDTAEGNYNRGNALAKAGRLEDAIAAYDRALELDPQHADAAYNRDLVKDYLAKNPPPPQQNQPQGGGERKDQDQQGKADAAKGDDQQDAESQARNGQGDRDDESSGDSQSGAQKPQNRPQPGDEEQNGEQQASEKQNQQAAQGQAAEAKDAEHWADEQAAEQWLRRIPQDPGGLLRRKFLYQYQRLGVDQDGKPVANDPRSKPW
ncbi:MAG TPA: VWA domain-containing protein [Gammaproteobacteria bacterium]|nr:VWA domain-containing protein [Gammaproteobacteria bacterium]